VSGIDDNTELLVSSVFWLITGNEGQRAGNIFGCLFCLLDGSIAVLDMMSSC
jgi:hypothetical protein